MIKIIDDNFEKEKWDAIANHPLQSWAWGEARKKMGIVVLRITDGKNVFQLTIHRLPITDYRIAYLPRSVFPSKEVLTFLSDWGQKHKIIFIKIEANETKTRLPITDYRLLISEHPLFPPWTQILDLTKSEDELLKNMHPKTRYNIRLAQKKGVAVREESTDQGFKTFSKLYFDTCRRQKYFGHTPTYHKIIWENLKQKISHILIAYYQETPLAAYELFHFKDTFYYPYGGTSLEYRNFMAANLIMWEAILLGKKLGAKNFDMWGSLPPNYDQKHDWAGFTKFKEGYGGEFVEMIGSYDLIINPVFYKIYNVLYGLRTIFLNLRGSLS